MTTSIEQYMNDGACWQAQMVLAYLRGHNEFILDASDYDTKARRYDAWIHVGRYENCREQGYVFSLRSWKHPDRQGNWVVYEHRNADDVCVVFFNKHTINTPTLNDVVEAMGDDKYNVTKNFKHDIMACCKWLEQEMTDWLLDCYAD
jgi:hypothetical protein